LRGVSKDGPRLRVVAMSGSDEAIQTIIGGKFWIASLTLAMTAMRRHSRDASAPELCHQNVPRKQRAQGMPGASATTHGPACNEKEHTSLGHHR
jgi:hypothetical protein